MFILVERRRQISYFYNFTMMLSHPRPSLSLFVMHGVVHLVLYCKGFLAKELIADHFRGSSVFMISCQSLRRGTTPRHIDIFLFPGLG